MFIVFLVCLIIAYLLGSLSSAIITCKLMGLPDPRSQGSGNPGATNVLRIGGRNAALLTLVGDFLKGLIPVLIAGWFGLDYMALGMVALAAILGHMFPLFFKFEGGKGVATALGAFFGISFLLGLVVVIVWVIVAAIWRYASLASLCAAFAAVIVNPWISGHILYSFPLLIIALLLAWRHKENIERLKSGTESKLNFGKKD